ncbi:MAG: hypothetical protein LBS45_12230 [Synergistaceae bacterium]|nr:hypothetical protein [Synergistaceae bacterium]
MDQLYEFLKNPPSLPPVRRAKIQAPTVQGIRKVDEYALPVLELAEYAGVEEFAMEGIRRVME